MQYQSKVWTYLTDLMSCDRKPCAMNCFTKQKTFCFIILMSLTLFENVEKLNFWLTLNKQNVDTLFSYIKMSEYVFSENVFDIS